MKKFIEGCIEFDFSNALNAKKFDNKDEHKLSHCMKAVDFIVETDQEIYFIEVKDPDHFNSTPESRKGFIKNLKSDKFDNSIVQKYRDSFLYEWAADNIPQKEIYYILLLEMKSLDPALLLNRNNSIKAKLPVSGPANIWKRRIVDGFLLLNMDRWNKHFPNWRVARINP